MTVSTGTRPHSNWPLHIVLMALGSFLLALIALIVCLPRFQTRELIGNLSMGNTVGYNESFLASRFSYLGSEPQRGDVIVFSRQFEGKKRYFVSRILGLPGETIEMRQSRIHIDGNAVRKEPYAPGGLSGWAQGSYQHSYTETLPNGVSYEIYDVRDDAPMDETPPRRIPQGHYFVIGDNRDNATDSRNRNLVGDVPRDSIVGRAIVVYDAIDRKQVGRRIR